MNEDALLDILGANIDNPIAKKLYAEYEALPKNADETADSKAFQEWYKARQSDIRHLDSDVVSEEKPMQPVAKQIRDFADNIDFLDQNPTYKAGLAKKFGISAEELDKELNSIIKAKEYQAGRVRRAKEIKEAGLFSPWTLASDYSKQRYIDDPDASIFGKEGNFNLLSTEGVNEVRDVILGGLGAVGDALPGVGGIFVGPGIRSMRDVANYGGRYGKDVGTIISDTGFDAFFNAGTQLLPTTVLRQGSKMGKGGAKTVGSTFADAAYDATKILDMAKEDKILRESIKKNGWENITKASTDVGNSKEFMKQVARLPDSQLKTDLMNAKTIGDKISVIANYNEELAKAPGAYGFFDPNTGAFKNSNYEVKKGSAELSGTPGLPQRALEREVYNNPTKLAKGLATTAKVWEVGGEPAVKLSKTARGRRTDWKEPEDKKHERWQKGYATWDEMKSDEYQTWLDANLKGLAK